MSTERTERHLEQGDRTRTYSESAATEAREGMNDLVSRQTARQAELKDGVHSGITRDFGRPEFHEDQGNGRNTSIARHLTEAQHETGQGVGADVCTTRERFDQNFNRAMADGNYREALDDLVAERRCQRMTSQEFDQRLAHVYGRLYIERGGEQEALRNLSPDERNSLHRAIALIDEESPPGQAAARWREIDRASQHEWRHSRPERRH